MSKFYIVAPVSSLSGRTRLFKLAKFIFSNSIAASIQHVCWEREPGEAKEAQLEEELVKKRIILRGGCTGGVRLMYIVWIIKIFFYSFSIPKKSKVWALGFESAFPLLFASKIKGFELYFDDADRFSMLFNWPLPVKYIIQLCEKLTSRNVYKHIIPGSSRYNFESKNFFLIQNMPSQSEVDTAKKLFKQKSWPKAKVVINVNGWLGESRGIDKVLTLAKHFSLDDLQIIMAGRLDSKAAEELVGLNNVTYLGVVSNAEALASYFASDFVFTYFSPNQQINLYAESNKWGDALKVGVGIIVNSEVKSAEVLIESNLAISQPYIETKELIKKIEQLIQKPELIDKLKKNAISHGKERPFFEEQLQSLFLE